MSLKEILGEYFVHLLAGCFLVLWAALFVFVSPLVLAEFVYYRIKGAAPELNKWDRTEHTGRDQL